jgi:hypothetical protein
MAPHDGREPEDSDEDRAKEHDDHEKTGDHHTHHLDIVVDVIDIVRAILGL